MSAALEAVKTMYVEATHHLNIVLVACHDDTERGQVWERYFAIRKNFDDCVNQTFEENDPELVQLEVYADASAEQLAKIEEQLGNIVKVLETLSTAVSYGTKIAAKVVTL